MSGSYQFFMDRSVAEAEFLGAGFDESELLAIGAEEPGTGVPAAWACLHAARVGKAQEHHLLDLRTPASIHVAVAEALENSVAGTGAPLYASLSCREFMGVLEGRGWERLKPRWGLFAACAGPIGEALRSLGPEPQSWFSPADFGLDHPVAPLPAG